MNTLKHAAVFAVFLLLTQSSSASEPTNQELMEMIKKQQSQIEALMVEVKNLKENSDKTSQKIEETEMKVEATADAIDSGLVSTSSQNRTTIGGYGELHYNNTDSGDDIDFHRFVLFFGHEFTDSIRFFSELELEHALSGDGKPGEVELEQAFVEMDLTQDTSMKAGVFLLPIGILNETHEPPTFYGVERNPVEKNIIPSTWWEAGASIDTQFSEGFSGDFAIHSGLSVPTDGSKSFLIRSGRQKVAKANADSLAFTARLKYTAIPGVELATSIQYQEDITQGSLGIDATLFTAHGIYDKNNFAIKALYAQWDLGGSANNQAQILGRDKQSGYYIEPSYRVNDQWGVFARYNAWDNNAGSNLDISEIKQTNIGINYWPHENVVFKFDLESLSGAADGDAFNLGVGYQF